MSKRPEKTINKNTAKTAKRLLKYVTDTYKLQFILVFVCIFISHCNIYLYKDDGIYRTRSPKTCQRRYV